MAYNQRQRNGAPRQDYYGHQESQYGAAYANEYGNSGSQQDHGYNARYDNDYENSAGQARLGSNKHPKQPPMYNYDSWGGASTGPKQRNHYGDSRNQDMQSFNPRVQDRNIDRGPTNGYQNEGHDNDFAFGQTNGSDHGQHSQRNLPYDSRRQDYPGARHQPYDGNQVDNAESWPDSTHQGNSYGDEQHQQAYGQRSERNHPPRTSPEKHVNKSNHQRGLDESKSPQKLSWDNPFPAFPGKSKKLSSHEDENGPDYQQGSNTESGHGIQQPRPSYGDRPRPSYEGQGSFDDGQGYAQTDGYPQQRPKISRSAHSDTAQAHDRPAELGAPEGYDVGDNARTMALPYRYDRSQTMPAAISHELQSQPPHTDRADWQEPGAVAGYYGPEDKGFLPNGSPHAAGRQPRMKPRSSSGESRRHNGGEPQLQYPAGNHNAHGDHLRDQFNTNHNTTQQTYPVAQYNDRPDRSARGGHVSDEEMPNFDVPQNGNASHLRGRTIDEHLQPQIARGPLPPLPPQAVDQNYTSPPGPPYGGDPVPRSKSQPDFQARRSPHPYNDPRPGPNFNGYPDRRPATSSSNERPGPYGRPLPGPPRGGRTERPLPRGPIQQGVDQGRRPSPAHRNGPYGPPRGQGAPHDRRSPGPQQPPPGQYGRTSDDRMRRNGPSPPNRTGTAPPPPPPHSNVNPDALPHHPAPVRPGLMASPPASQNGKPPPIRRYDETPSPMSPPTAPSDAGSAPQRANKRESQPVTYQELDRLRQRVNSNPEDQATRLLLAKKLVEASIVLVDERADQRARAKAREDYVMQAHKIVKKLASNNYPDGMFYLGDCYSRGSLGLATDPKEAFTLYQSAAKANHAQAAYRVAVCCEMGQDEGGGTRKDPVKAMQWYKRAATLGDTSGMYKMGIIQLKGLLGQPKNVKDALTWLKQAADRADEENPHALHELALLYDKPAGMDGVPRDEAQAKRLFTQAAKLGYKFSQFRLGSAYEYGLLGCPVDPRQSIAWYSKAAVQEEHQSELALSGWYLTGSDGVLQQSDTEAYLWARKAAQAGLAKAEYAMGYFTEVGIGAPSNLEDAKRWYWRAASQNFPKARERLEDLRKGSPIKQKARVSRSNMKKQSDGECSVM